MSKQSSSPPRICAAFTSDSKSRGNILSRESGNGHSRNECHGEKSVTHLDGLMGSRTSALKEKQRGCLPGCVVRRRRVKTVRRNGKKEEERQERREGIGFDPTRRQGLL
jgi:hypothetical protein